MNKITIFSIIFIAIAIPLVLAAGGYAINYHFADGTTTMNATNVCVSTGECLVSLTGLSGNYTMNDSCFISFKNGEAYATNCSSF